MYLNPVILMTNMERATGSISHMPCQSGGRRFSLRMRRFNEKKPMYQKKNGQAGSPKQTFFGVA